MFGLDDLKNSIVITETGVECPVRDCSETVKRQRRSFKTSKEFWCPIHNIYISPSTFEYGCMCGQHPLEGPAPKYLDGFEHGKARK